METARSTCALPAFTPAWRSVTRCLALKAAAACPVTSFVACLMLSELLERLELSLDVRRHRKPCLGEPQPDSLAAVPTARFTTRR